MPYAVSNGVRIYYEIEGRGAPLMLHHGLTGSMNEWKNSGYMDIFKENYRLIMLDARGHGKSEKPHNPESYSSKHMVDDAVSVLDHLGIEKSSFFGYSMGGRIGLASGKYAPSRFGSLIIGGFGLMERDSKETIEEHQSVIQFFKRGKEVYDQYLESNFGDILTLEMRSDMSQYDLNVVIAYLSLKENIGLSEFLPKMTNPCLLYAGDQDPYHSKAEQCVELMQNARFVSVSGFDHDGCFLRKEARDTIIPHILEFLEETKENNMT